MRVIQTCDLRDRTEELLESLTSGDEPFAVKDSGDVKAVLVSLTDWEQLQSAVATREEQRDPESLNSLHRALQDIASGRLTLHEEVVRQYREAHAP